MTVISFDDLVLWVQACEQWAVLFRWVMFMAMENLAIAWHQDFFWYATIHGRGYEPRVRGFELGDYVYLKQTTPTTLDVIASHVTLHV